MNVTRLGELSMQNIGNGLKHWGAGTELFNGKLTDHKSERGEGQVDSDSGLPQVGPYSSSICQSIKRNSSQGLCYPAHLTVPFPEVLLSKCQCRYLSYSKYLPAGFINLLYSWALWCPFGLLHSELSLTEATWWEFTSVYCATCLYRRCWHSRNMQVIVIDPVSQSNCHFDTNLFQQHLIILQRYILLEALIHLFKSLFSVHLSQL